MYAIITHFDLHYMLNLTIEQKIHWQKEMLKINQEYIKSPINYVGNKYCLIKQIIPLFPKKISMFLGFESHIKNDGEFDFEYMEFRTDEILRLIKKQGGTY